MNRHAPHHPGADPALVAMANQADRSNRPAIFIVIAAALLVATLAYLVASFISYQGASERLRIARAQTVNAMTTLQEIQRLRALAPSEDDFPSTTLHVSRLRNVAAEVWDLDEDSAQIDQIISLPASPERRAIIGGRRDALAGDFSRSMIPVTINGQPLDKILQFAEQALAHERLQVAFVSRLRLAPAPRGWNAVIEFRQYEYEEGPGS